MPQQRRCLPEDPDVRLSFSKGLGEPTYELDPLLSYLRRRHEAGENTLHSPLPSPDQLEVGGGLIGDFFSEDRLLEIADVLYRKAIVGLQPAGRALAGAAGAAS